MTWSIFGFFAKSENHNKEYVSDQGKGKGDKEGRLNEFSGKSGDNDSYMKDYLSSLKSQHKESLFKNEPESFREEEESIKQKYLQNPVQVSLEKGDEAFFGQSKSQTIEDNKEVLKETETEKTKEAAADDMLKMIKNPEFVKDFKYRQSKINSMAKENCSDYEQSFYYCMKNGTYSERFSLCHVKYAAFCDCVASQEDILDKLGYAKFGNPSKLDEQLAEAAYDVIVDTETKKE